MAGADGRDRFEWLREIGQDWNCIYTALDNLVYNPEEYPNREKQLRYAQKEAERMVSDIRRLADEAYGLDISKPNPDIWL